MRQTKVYNKTRGTVIAEVCPIAESVRDRTVGLLGSDHLDDGHGLLIRRSPSIHMFFMRFGLDVIFVNRDLRATKCVENLKPWRAVLWAPGAVDCIELPVGAIARSRTVPGDQLELGDAVELPGA